MLPERGHKGDWIDAATGASNVNAAGVDRPPIDAGACCGLTMCETPDAAKLNVEGGAGLMFGVWWLRDMGFIFTKTIIRKTYTELDITVIDAIRFKTYKNNR